MKNLLTMDGGAGRFLINGKPEFLLGASYYGGLAADSATLERDLMRLRDLGFNWIRVWCTWGAYAHDVSAVHADGSCREPYMTRLQELCRLADSIDMIVDVSLQRGISPELQGRGEAMQNRARLPWMMSPIIDHRGQVAAVRAMAEAVRPFRNVYIDVSNERNHPVEAPVTFPEAAELIAVVRQVDPQRLVTISDTGEIDDETMSDYVQTAGVDFLTPHRPRNERSPGETLEKTVDYRRMAEDLGQPMPIHYQEPFRRDFTRWQPAEDDFLIDLAGAVRGGAAGWCFHNGYNRHAPDGRPRRSFDLREGPLFDQVDEVERQVLQRSGQVVAENLK